MRSFRFRINPSLRRLDDNFGLTAPSVCRAEPTRKEKWPDINEMSTYFFATVRLVLPLGALAIPFIFDTHV